MGIGRRLLDGLVFLEIEVVQLLAKRRRRFHELHRFVGGVGDGPLYAFLHFVLQGLQLLAQRRDGALEVADFHPRLLQFVLFGLQ